MNLWYTGDQHLDHKNIIEYCNRPFDSVEEMNQEIIDLHNSMVRERDIVIHVGDFTLGELHVAGKHLSCLKGIHYFIKNQWHHDKKWMKLALQCFNKGIFVEGFNSVAFLEAIDVRMYKGHLIVASHYPQARWERRHHGAIHVHGHSHGNYHPPDGEMVFDVGVDANWFYPTNADIIISMANKVMEGRGKNFDYFG